MFQKVLERNKQHQRARYWKARALESLPGTRSLDAARAEYETVAKAADKNPKLKMELCDVYRRRGRLMAKNCKEWKTAESSFSRFLECQPKDAEAWLARGKIRADLGRLDDAISDFERAGRQFKTRWGLFDNAHSASENVNSTFVAFRNYCNERSP